MAEWSGYAELASLPPRRQVGIEIRDYRLQSDDDIALQLRAAFHDVCIEDLKPISTAIEQDWLRVAQRARGLF